MRVVTLARKLLSESNLAYNVMEHGTGGLQINNTRLWRGPWPADCVEAPGLWTANAILMHRSTCQFVDWSVESNVINRWEGGAKPFGDGAGHAYKSQPTYTMVENWDCVKDCPSRQVNLQRKDSSRFFKQVADQQDLIAHLSTLLKLDDESQILVEMDLDSVDWSSIKTHSLAGVITEGTSEPYTEEILRVLKPGGHVMLLSPESEPTGHTGACALEDAGFEIRDGYLIVDSLDFHYVVKPSGEEKNAGVKYREKESIVDWAKLKDLNADLSEFNINRKTLKSLLAGEAVEWKKLPEEMENLVDISKEKTFKKYQNDHPTVKPKKIFEVLYQDVPKNHTIVDPFMGSGSSGLAAVTTGHEFIGVDLESEYVKISAERIRNHANMNAPWKDIVVQADTDTEEVEEDDELDLEELFG